MRIDDERKIDPRYAARLRSTLQTMVREERRPARRPGRAWAFGAGGLIAVAASVALVVAVLPGQERTPVAPIAAAVEVSCMASAVPGATDETPTVTRMLTVETSESMSVAAQARDLCAGLWEDGTLAQIGVEMQTASEAPVVPLAEVEGPQGGGLTESREFLLAVCVEDDGALAVVPGTFEVCAALEMTAWEEQE